MAKDESNPRKESKIDNITRDEAIALLGELDKIKESLDKFEQIDTTIFDSIVTRNKVDRDDSIVSESDWAY